MQFDLTILGSNSALPAVGRNPSSQVLQYDSTAYLIDCGEGTQVQLHRYKIRRGRIKNIFISHLHGDHYYGLIGLITSYSLYKREDALNIYGPAGIEKIVNLQLELSGARLGFPLNFIHVDGNRHSLIMEDKNFKVYSIPLSHRIECNGFLFEEKIGRRRLTPELLKKFQVPVDQMNALKDGADLIRDDGTVIPNQEVTEDPFPIRKYAYCSDTAYDERIIPIIDGVDLLYHESTFAESEKQRAQETRHSTAKEAGLIAKKAKVGKLILGHFSSRYSDLTVLQNEAKEVFSDTFLGEEGSVFEVDRKDHLR